MARILIITNGNYFATRILEPLIARRRDEIAAILQIGGDYKGRTGFAAAKWLIRATTLPYFVYKVISVLLFSFARKVRPGARFVIGDVGKVLECRVLALRDYSIAHSFMNAPDRTKLIRHFGTIAAHTCSCETCL